jgi:two-component system, NarL family, sensor histidine kinase EvgS
VVDLSTERQLQQQVADQAAHDAAQRHLLLASASHELRAPTHTLSLALQSIDATGLPQPSSKALGIAREAASNLTQLLDDVLDVARFQAGRMELRPLDFDLHTLIQQVRDAHAGALAAKGLRFDVVLASGLQHLVYLDPLRLKQVLNNLLSNATKYTQRGSVTLRISASQNQAAADGLVFEVQDTGQGMDPAQQARLFEPFGSVPTQTGSSGLGLSICRRLVSLMNGTLHLDSQPGRGSTVLVWLPLPVSRRSGAGQALKTEGAVLVCDDDAVCRMLMAEAVRRSGHPVIEVSSGDEALQRWRGGGVRLLVTDLTMPGLDGHQLIQAIRDEELTARERTAIVICSGTPAAPHDAASGPPLFDAFLAKPLDLATLYQTLLALGLQGARHEVESHSTAQPAVG